MHTEMHDAQVYHVRLVSARKVVFTLDLRDNENLRDPAVIERSMAGYMLAYPNLHTWEAVYVGDWLVLTAAGTIRMSTMDAYL